MSDSTIPARTTLARLLRPQGRHGEVLAELLTDFPERFTAGLRVYVAAEDFAGPEEAMRSLLVESYWLPVGRNAGRIVLRFSGIDSISAAEQVAGLDVVVPDTELMPLEDGAAYVADLVGCTVFDGSLRVGTVADVSFPVTSDGSRRLPDVAPLLVVETAQGDEVLIPYANALLLELNLAEQRISMQLPAGLVELNQGSATTVASTPVPPGSDV